MSVHYPPHRGVAPVLGGSLPPTPEPLRGSHSPAKLPPTQGGSTPQAKILRIFPYFGPKTLCFNRDFELIRKIGLLPPTVGGSIGGSILAVGGEQGVARVGIWERSINTPILTGDLSECCLELDPISHATVLTITRRLTRTSKRTQMITRAVPPVAWEGSASV